MQCAQIPPAVGRRGIDLLNLPFIEGFDFAVDEHFVSLGAADVRDRKHHAFGIWISGEIDAILFLNAARACLHRFRCFHFDRLGFKDCGEIGTLNFAPEIFDALRVFIGYHHVLKERQNGIQITQHDILVGDGSGKMRPVVAHLHHFPHTLTVAGRKIGK